MKGRVIHILALLLFSFCFSTAMGQTPQKMSYQAIVRNSSNNLIANTIVGMKISVIQGSESGTAVYIETHSVKTNINGLVTLAIGGGDPTRGTFSAVKWGEGPYFIQTETDPTGGTNYTISGVSQLMSVPYALYAVSSGSGTGSPGKSAFEIWKAQPGNENKTEADFIVAIKGEKGDKGVKGNDGQQGDQGLKGDTGVRGEMGSKGESGPKGEKGDVGAKGDTGEKGTSGVDGKSVYDIWKNQPENSSKTETDFITAMKGEKGNTGEKGEAGNSGGGAGEKGEKGDTGTKGDKGENGIDGLAGKSAFELWQVIPGNETKVIEDFYLELKGPDGKTILNGIADPEPSAGKPGDFYINTGTQMLFGPKAEGDLWPIGISLKGVDAIGFDFKGSFQNLEAYKAIPQNTETLNKAYYNITDKKSYVFNGTEWKVFAQDGTGGSGGELNFNVDRNITRTTWPFGVNLGRGKTTAQFLEEVFFPRIAATKPVIVFGSSATYPYSIWKNWSGLSTNVNLNWTVTNKSKTDDSDDKEITSIRLLSGSTELATAVPENSGTTQSGVFSAVEFKKMGGDNKTDFSKTYTLEVKDAEANVVTSPVTLTMNKAIQLTVSAPTLNTSKYEYEYSNNDISLSLNWNVNKGDETITDVKVGTTSKGTSVSTGSINATGSTPVVFKSPINGGADTEQFTLTVSGDIYGAAGVQKSPALKWVYTSYYGSFSSSVSPCNASFNITDDQIKSLTPVLGGTLKGDTGFDFNYNAAGQYTVFAYPDDGKTPAIEYFDTITGKWQPYPAAQIKEIIRTGFRNASGYTAKDYRIILVCVEYREAAAKVRIK